MSPYPIMHGLRQGWGRTIGSLVFFSLLPSPFSFPMSFLFVYFWAAPDGTGKTMECQLLNLSHTLINHAKLYFLLYHHSSSSHLISFKDAKRRQAGKKCSQTKWTILTYPSFFHSENINACCLGQLVS